MFALREDLSCLRDSSKLHSAQFLLLVAHFIVERWCGCATAQELDTFCSSGSLSALLLIVGVLNCDRSVSCPFHRNRNAPLLACVVREYKSSKI